MAVLACLVLFLALAGHSSAATYCICKDGLSDQVLQKALDYACGAGADCTPILQNGACYNPNTIKDHCSYAVNSYYQRKSSSGATCDFSGTATQSQNPPTTAASTCTYPSSSSNAGTPSTTTPSTTTPPGTTTPSGTTTPVFGTPTGISPSGTGFTDSSDGVLLSTNTNLLFSLALTLWLSGLMLLVWG